LAFAVTHCNHLVVKANEEEVIGGNFVGFGYGVRTIRIGTRCTGDPLKFDPTRSTIRLCSYVAKISPITAMVAATAITNDSECSPSDLHTVISYLCPESLYYLEGSFSYLKDGFHFAMKVSRK
jgi:hypothetical protein